MSSQKSLTSHSTTTLNSFEPVAVVVQVDEDTISKAGIPLDDDPFARVEGVKMLKPAATTPPPTKEGKSRSTTKGSLKEKEGVNGSQDDTEQVAAETHKQDEPTPPMAPLSSEERRKARKKRRGTKSESVTEPPAPKVAEMAVQEVEMAEQEAEVAVQEEQGNETDIEEPHEPITLLQFLSDPTLLSSLLAFLSFYDWCVLAAVSKEIRIHLVRTKELREVVLESYLRTVGYSRWIWDDPDPLSLSLQVRGLLGKIYRFLLIEHLRT